MLTPREIRNRWSNRVFLKACVQSYTPPWSVEFPNMLSAVRKEFDVNFIKEMRNRCLVGVCRYGPVTEDPLGFIDRLKKKVAEYEHTGNQDLLPDIANYAMFERIKPQHPRAHWPTTFDQETHPLDSL